jgi:hypothetical protein
MFAWTRHNVIPARTVTLSQYSKARYMRTTSGEAGLESLCRGQHSCGERGAGYWLGGYGWKVVYGGWGVQAEGKLIGGGMWREVGLFGSVSVMVVRFKWIG